LRTIVKKKSLHFVKEHVRLSAFIAAKGCDGHVAHYTQPTYDIQCILFVCVEFFLHD